VQAIFLHFALEFLFLQGAMETAEHHVRIKGLQQIVVGAQLHGAHTDARFVFARNHQESQARIPLANFNQEIRAGDAGNAQIRNYDVAWVAWGGKFAAKETTGAIHVSCGWFPCEPCVPERYRLGQSQLGGVNACD
jgi:hypothetical protein